MSLCCLVVMLSEYEVFPKGYSSGSYNMQQGVFNALMEECSAFLQFLMMMAYGFEYNACVLWMLQVIMFLGPQLLRWCTWLWLFVDSVVVCRTGPENMKHFFVVLIQVLWLRGHVHIVHVVFPFRFMVLSWLASVSYVVLCSMSLVC